MWLSAFPTQIWIGYPVDLVWFGNFDFQESLDF